MKKLLLLILTLIILPTGSVAALEAEPKPAELKTSPLLVTGYEVYSDGVNFVQIYNNSSQLLNLEGWFVQWRSEAGSGDVNVKVELKDWLPANEYLIVAESGAVDGADLEFAHSQQGKVKELQLIPPPQTYAPYITKDNLFSPIGRYVMEPTAAGNFTASRPFVLAKDDSPLYGGGLYKVPENSGLAIVEILANPKHCSPEDADSLGCNNYVKLLNPTSKPIDLDLYRLRIGWGNDLSSVTNTFSLSGKLEPGGYRAVGQRDDGQALNITSGGGYVWLEDIYGIKKYGNTAYQYPDLGGENHRGFSWALNPKTNLWQWAVPSPNGVNNFDVPPMPKESSSSTLKPCTAGQERNPETNRCRNIASAAASLQPCKPGQERNPETNRCRSTAASASALKPCGPGEERNPETNRCRKVAGASTELPNIQDIQSAPDARSYRWWVVGLTAGGAAGLGAWEWRRDIMGWLARLKNPGGGSSS